MVTQMVYRKPGGLIDPAAENTLLDDIDSATNNLDSGSLRTEAIHRAHLNSPYGDISRKFLFQSNIPSTGTYSSAVYVPINHGTPMLLDFGASGFYIPSGWVVRFQWSVFITDFERAGGIGEYSFCLKTDTSGAGTFVQQSPDYWFSAMSYPRTGPSTATYWPMINRRHTMSYCMVRPTPFTIYGARVDVKIASPWTVDIQNNNLFTLLQSH